MNDPVRVPENGIQRRTRWGRLWRWFFAPIYYHLDLTDHRTGRPVNAKVVYTATVVVALVGLIRFGLVISASPTGLNLEFILYLTAVLAFSAGVDTFKTWLKTRGGGLADAQVTREMAAPERLKAEAVLEEARAKIGARRTQGGGDYEVTS